MKKLVITIAAALMMGLAYQMGHNHGFVECQEINDRALAESPMCWGDELMENFVIDVVDETDYWDMTDSTAFRDLAENSSEWYLAVIVDYCTIMGGH